VRGATSDITDRMQADMEATLHRNELAHLSRVVMLGQLSGSIAHELNQPLTAILSNAQAALRFMDSESVDLETLREILRDIADDDIRAGETILRLRALFERGETRNDPIHSNALAIEVLRLLRSDLISRNIAVTTELRPDLPLIQGDRVQLQQVLFNLVFNACEAMASGSAATRVLLIRTAMAVDARHVVVSVVDGGPGIAPDQLEKIFEPFVTSKRFGVGLGLVISRNIVSAHGGRLWAFNNEGHGATFSFTIPFAEAITASRADTTSVVTPTGAREEQEQ
jgi:C4-dicarboxylate-specific signal transduction histidine kinase